jgi:hypothetical protein
MCKYISAEIETPEEIPLIKFFFVVINLVYKTNLGLLKLLPPIPDFATILLILIVKIDKELSGSLDSLLLTYVLRGNRYFASDWPCVTKFRNNPQNKIELNFIKIIYPL